MGGTISDCAALFLVYKRPNLKYNLLGGVEISPHMGVVITIRHVMSNQPENWTEGYYWFRSDSLLRHMFCALRKDNWEIVYVYEAKRGWRAILEKLSGSVPVEDLEGEWQGPLEPMKPKK